MTVACTNPARPEQRVEKLDSYWNARSTQAVRVAGSPGRAKAPHPRPIFAPKGWCRPMRHEGPRGYLSVRTNADPNDKRTDRIGGEVAILGMFCPAGACTSRHRHCAGRPRAAGRCPCGKG